LLLPDATIIPARARVFCQLIEFRLSQTHGVAVDSLNQFNWSPDYDAVRLSSMCDRWKPLSDVEKVMEFNFSDYQANAEPRTTVKAFKATRNGVMNAVAMWYELDLSDTEVISTSPYDKDGRQQAVHFVEEIELNTGDTVLVEVSNDTYALSVKVENSEAFRRSGVPLTDDAWLSKYLHLKQINEQLMKRCGMKVSREKTLTVDCPQHHTVAARVPQLRSGSFYNGQSSR
jgi:DNA-binding transcriptional MocR family regulator